MIIKHLKNKAFAEFWMIPEDIYGELLAKTKAWINDLPEKMDTIEKMTPGLNIDIYKF
ncbi:MAG: hypothetical protein JW891_01380 [Candidatus Lokiarchaeota archaeon]|nr:hypothetical protein [Candidatus Lokiarchaeota archaeon]